MTEIIGGNVGNEALGRFLFDFRRALMQHRKVRHMVFMHLQFPGRVVDEEMTVADLVDRLDLDRWLSESPPAEVEENRQYRLLRAELVRLRDLATSVIGLAGKQELTPDMFGAFLHALHQFEQTADRVASGITTAMTDLDELTGLLNRAAMERDLSKAQVAASQTGRAFCIAMIDADLFKQVNDDHGHGFGDFVLSTLADRFVASLRPRDQVYRYGGEEFLLLLPDTDLPQAWSVLERLRRRAGAEAISEGDVSVTITVSLGATVVEPGEGDMRAAIGRADAALYCAKEGGRNCIELDPPSLLPERNEAMNTNPEARQGNAKEQAETARYDRFVELSRELFDKGQEKGREAWERAMELARQQLAVAGDFSMEQGEAFKSYLRRDLDQTAADMRQLGVEAQERLNPARLGAGALSSLARLLHAAGGTMTAWSEKAEAALEFKTGELTSAGTLTCQACGQKVHLKSTGVVPPCPSCHATRYRKGY